MARRLPGGRENGIQPPLSSEYVVPGNVLDGDLSGSESGHLEEVFMHRIAESDARRDGTEPAHEPEGVDERDSVRGTTRPVRYDAGVEFDVICPVIDHRHELDATALINAHKETPGEKVFRQDRLAETPVDLAIHDGFGHHLSDGFRTRPPSDLLDGRKIISLSEPHVHVNEHTR
jgi:hypothetical protein